MFGFLKRKEVAPVSDKTDDVEPEQPTPNPREGKPIDTAYQNIKPILCSHCKTTGWIAHPEYYCNHRDNGVTQDWVWVGSTKIEPCTEEDWKRCPLNEERE